jgi:F-type H+-transporting ATPase subunit b
MNINVTLFAQAVTFLAFIWFTKAFVWPPLLKAIETRQKKIADGLAEAERGKMALSEANKQVETVIRDARERSQEILAQSEKRAAQIVEEAKNNAKAEGDRLLTAAKAQIDQEVQAAKTQLRDQVAALAVAGAEKILRKEVNAQVHADLLNQLKQEL